MTKQNKSLMIIIVLAMLSLQACMDVATSGAEAVYNRRSLQKTINDQYITMQAFKQINHKTTDFQNANVVISTFNGEVLLTGQVPEAWQKKKAEQIVRNIPDVGEVHNLITIESPSSSLTKMSDAWLTSKVKAKLIASEDVDATLIKVVTENGTVYLMGILPPSEAQAAVDIASNTDGVARVVKMFSYITISKKLTSNPQ